MGPCHEPTREKGDSIPDETAMNAEEKEAMYTVKIEKEVNPERTYDELAGLVEFAMNAEAMATTKLEKEITALNNGMQVLYSNHEVMKSNLNKAEEEVKLLFNQNKALAEANKRLLSLLEREQKNRSERKHSARNSTKMVDILVLSTAREQQQQQQDSSEDEEPTQLDPKDKGLFNFLKAVSDVSCTVTNTFNIVFVVLAYIASGRHATSELQKLVLVACGICFMTLSIITAAMVHSLERKANFIDVATGLVLAEIFYAFAVPCLVAMFVAKAPWFVVVPLFFTIWLLMTDWLVTQFCRPRWLYKGLRSAKKRFKDKGHR